MTSQTSDQSTVGLGSLVKSGRFKIPKHQRDFQWDADRIGQFYSDIDEALDRNEGSYFLGLMVFQTGDDNKLIVLDGQQRITTCLLIFSAIRNWLTSCVAQDIKSEALKVEDWFLGSSELGQSTPLPKLELNATNNQDFVTYVVNKGDALDGVGIELKSLSTKHRRRRLLEGIKTAATLVTEKAKEFQSEKETATYFYSFICYAVDKVRVVNLTVPSDGAAYSIFETLNDRGMSLAPLDLIKNHVFSRIDGNKSYNLDHAQDRWTEMLTLLQNVDANKFIGVFWRANHELVQNPKIFSAFKEKYNTASAAFAASKNMRSAAELYAGLENPDDIIWITHTTKTKRFLGNLKVIGATQVHPVLLAMLSKQFDPTQMEDAIRALETVLVRYQLIGSGRPGALERLGAEIAQEITTKKIITAAQIRAKYLGLLPSDQEFISAFTRHTETTSKKCHYLLVKLELQARAEAGNPSQGDIPTDTSVEHIMPKSPGPDWQSVTSADQKIVEDCAHRLGNMCLLGKDKLGNLSFKIKSVAYQKASHILTKKVSEFKTYDRQLVEGRQKHMATLAKTIWRFPD